MYSGQITIRSFQYMFLNISSERRRRRSGAQRASAERGLNEQTAK